MAFGNVRLEQAIDDVAVSDTPERRRALVAVLVESDLVVAMEGDEVVLGDDGDDVVWLPVFTDVAAMRRAFPGAYDPRVVSAHDALHLVLGTGAAGLAVNPAGPTGGLLPLEELEAHIAELRT